MVLEGIDATANLEPGGRTRFSAAADAVTIHRGDRQVTLDRPRVEAHATLTDGQVVVTVVPALTALGPARVELALALHPLRLERLDARASALELAAWLPLLPGGVELAGIAELSIEGSPATALRTRVVIPRATVQTPTVTLAAAVRLTGTLTIDGGSLRGPVEATVELESGTSGWPALLLPARLTAGGDAILGARSGFAGHLELATAAAGTIAVEGTVDVADQAALDLDWRWQGGDVANLVELATTTGDLTFLPNTIWTATCPRRRRFWIAPGAVVTVEVAVDQAPRRRTAVQGGRRSFRTPCFSWPGSDDP
jgi:hypothetical protein